MIIARSPLRITLGGGSTDLPSYYQKYGGFVISAAIDKYVYITLHKTFVSNFVAKYSELERVENAKYIKHPIIREAFSMLNVDGKFMELASVADIPSGTGLGSSSSFTTALLRALYGYKREAIGSIKLAEAACEIEIIRLKEPIGKKDQYISACGGITCFNFLKSGQVEMYPLKIDNETLHSLEDNLLLFFTGYSRASSSILNEQDTKTKNLDSDIIDNLHFIKELGIQNEIALMNGDLNKFSNNMNIYWKYKKERSENMSNSDINKWHDIAMNNGASGGYLIGAGGGGFLMFYANDKNRLRLAMKQNGLEEVRFKFDFEGCKLINS